MPLDETRDAAAGLAGMVGASPPMQALFGLIESVAPSSASVLIEGESGTGKELVARAIHRMSPRASGRFVVLNCSAVPETLMEDELFGHQRGAFTGAVAPKAGLFEEADRGTMMLDEIGDMPLPMQIKLLRVLQEGEVRRIGSTDERRVDVRVVAATHVNLAEAIRRGRFREDLYYRINVVNVSVPPLRRRMDDLPLLARHFLSKFCTKTGRTISGIHEDAMELLRGYEWPGNVRELENVVERAVVIERGSMISVASLPPHLIRRHLAGRHLEGDAILDLPYARAREAALRSFESRYVSRLLERSGGSISEAARLAGLDRSNFKRVLRRSGAGDKP